jgi:hypothetical protein
MRQRQYHPFIDWLKAAGLALIVFGHVAARTSLFATPPVYQKQLGVAFFVFVTGFTLACEQRPRWRVVYNRVFEVCVVGLLFALLMSAIGLRFWNDANESNYLPLIGITTLYMNDFPANPTTWYIGTYIHLVMIWAIVLRRVRVTLWMLLAVAATEIVVRAGLTVGVGRYTSYMFFGNWMMLLMLGMWTGQRDRRQLTESRWGALMVLVAIAVGWPLLVRGLPWRLAFPFMDLGTGGTAVLMMSAMVSIVYVAYTLAAYTFVRTLPRSAVVQFFARNTVFVFITHMPVYYMLEHTLVPVTSYGVRVTLEFLVCFIALAFVSEAFRCVLRPELLRERLGARLTALLDGAPPPARADARGSVRW